MSANRDAKTEVVDEVKTRLAAASATVVTEYRGLTVAEMATLRRSLRAVGGDYKVFKNTLVRRAVEGSGHAPLVELLEGPTAIAFVTGDVSAVAKTLRDFARTAPALVLKGGVFEGSLLGARELASLADLPSREVLLAQVAGALASPMRTMAGLLKALPQNLAYGLSALLDQRGGARIATDATAAEDAAATGASGDVSEPADAQAPEATQAQDAADGEAQDAADGGTQDAADGEAAGQAAAEPAEEATDAEGASGEPEGDSGAES